MHTAERYMQGKLNLSDRDKSISVYCDAEFLLNEFWKLV